MNAVADAPPATQNQTCTDEQLTWARAAYLDLHHRAEALDNLIATTHSWNPVDDGGAAPTVLTVRVDRDAWFIAVDAALTPRPAPPSPNA